MFKNVKDDQLQISWRHFKTIILQFMFVTVCTYIVHVYRSVYDERGCTVQ